MVGGADAGEAFGGVGACGDVCAVEAADEGGEVLGCHCVGCVEGEGEEAVRLVRNGFCE